MKPMTKYLATGAIVLAALAAGVYRWRVHLENPWTRDGQVQANVIQIAPRVSGPIVTLPIRNNQLVHAGDLLLEIDPRTYQASLDQARAQLDQAGGNLEASLKQIDSARASVEVSRATINQAQSAAAQVAAVIAKNKAEFERQQDLLPKRATSKKALERAQAMYDISLEDEKVAVAGVRQAEANLLKSQAALAEAQARLGALGDANPQYRLAVAALRQADLNLEFTKIRAPADGYIANLRLRIGSHVVANQPTLALVDTASYWVDGFFKEDEVGGIASGDRAVVTLMSYPDRQLSGVVDSVGWGISQQDGSTGVDLLPKVSATFEWIRLAQRIPVRVHLADVPKDIQLRVGTTCSVLVRKNSGSRTQ
jgi:multidrug resistance efflux pump